MKSENNLSDNTCNKGNTGLEDASASAVQPRSPRLGHWQAGSDRYSMLIKKHWLWHATLPLI